MVEQHKREGPDFDRIGLFKEMSYLEYIPPEVAFNEESKKGKQMMTNCTKSKNGTQNGYFDKIYSRPFEGEAYVDPIRLRRLDRLEKAKKNVGQLFQYSNPPKKPSGAGSNYGTFNDYVDKTEYFSSKNKDVDPDPPPKKNFFVNPGKKGTGYGYANVTIGKVPPYFIEKEYEEKLTSPQMPAKESSLHQPYRAGIFKEGYFGPNPFVQTDNEIPTQEEDEGEGSEIGKVFYPTSPAKKDGGMKAGCLNKLPEYTADPYLKKDLVPRGVKRYVNKENQMFRPVPGPKPYPVKSIITKNVQKKVNPKNYTTIKGVVYCKK